ncbi:response regulator transcription factor [Sinomicrobium pectinilyticum]|uniref:DNA-binding response regulator n=1 Tax=Sinomicrobium pectinilyticum TaxID=1084421 RepID=A0A3N0DQS4_SINP1|nr:response regulator transcription factor [Sinomicrobium pectinilyticum]RNL77982.1 DNA-binding response regulator [Sinomicrobium pectinilyticum]
MIKVLLVDDHPLIRRGIRSLVLKMADVTAIAEAENGEEALKKIFHHRPDFVFIDISIPRVNGIEVIRKVKKELPEIAFIVLTIHNDPTHFQEAMAAGAIAYLPKKAGFNKVQECLDAVLRGETYVDDFLEKEATAANSAISGLTKRETDVLKGVIHGKSNREIASNLLCSEKNIEKFKTKIRKKLDIPPSYGALLDWAIHNEVYL